MPDLTSDQDSAPIEPSGGTSPPKPAPAALPDTLAAPVPAPSGATNLPAHPEGEKSLFRSPAPATGGPRQTGGRCSEGLPEQFGRYRIEKLLGKGGMGSVYLARDPELERIVALKVPRLDPNHPSILERFYREARTAATLNHPALCPVYDVGCADGVPYMTMAFIEGRSLADAIRGHLPWSQHAAATLVRSVALALEEAHRKGVIHRDLKPANIMLNERGEPVVMDFGLARRIEPDAEPLTRVGQILGTPLYMAPEQVAGDPGGIGPATDVYCLGVILFELLTGQTPFAGNPQELLTRILVLSAPLAADLRPDVSPLLEAACARALAKKPAERFASMKEFAATLERFLGSEERPPASEETGSSPFAQAIRLDAPTPSGPATIEQTPEVSALDPPTVPLRNRRASRRLALAATALVAITALAGAAWWLALWNAPTGRPTDRALAAATSSTDREPRRPLEKTGSEEYVLRQQLADVRRLPAEARAFARYFSSHHLLAAGASAADLDQQRIALALALNSLSWEDRIVNLRAIDAPANTVFAIDIRELGWQRRPFVVWRANAAAGNSPVTLFDLVLLEYPYGVVPTDSETFARLADEFLVPAAQVRPIPHLRADWFTSSALQAPLYEDLLQLPQTLGQLEARLEVHAVADLDEGRARRAGVSPSQVSPSSRVLERHAGKHGAYWKAFELGGKDRGALEADPVRLRPAGVDGLFTLPNGLHGYFLADAEERRTSFRSTRLLVDRHAADQTVRNGLSCVRCHQSGVIPARDAVRSTLQESPGNLGFDRQAALRLYPDQAELDRLYRQDGERFRTAAGRIEGWTANANPLLTVSRGFLNDPLNLAAAAGELGVSDPAAVATQFRSPAFAGLGLLPLAADGVMRRDAWEEHYHQVIDGLGLGTPIAPLDSHDFAALPAPLDVALRTNKNNNQFEPGDEMTVWVDNRSDQPLHIELIGTSSLGRKVILTPPGTVVPAGSTYRFPREGAAPIRIKADLGREQITLFASETAFPAGELLRGDGVADRVIHAFYGPSGTDSGERRPNVKKTIEIETR